MRWSSLDMYNHVKERFTEEHIKMPYDTFHANKVLINGLYSILESVCYINDMELEACGEPGFDPTPCISQKDIDILGLSDEIKLIGNAEQRHGCSCPANKVQILKQKPAQCENKCLYCFWKD